MPRLCEFYGIVIYMYWADHEPAHFHAIYAGEEAQVLVDSGEVLAGSLPRTAAKLVREWTALRRAELLEDWRRAQALETLVPIDGLQQAGCVATLARIRQAEALGGLSLRLTFTDGVVRELDLEPMLIAGVLAALRDPEVFAQVEVDPVAGTVMWPNGIDLDPDVLHGDHDPAHGAPPRLLNQYHLRPTAQHSAADEALPRPATWRSEVIVRCTAKVLKLLDARPISAPPGDDDWQLNLIWLSRRKSLLLTHASTLFPVFVADVRTADLADLGSWLGSQVVEALRDEDLPTDVLGDLHSPATISTTASRRVLGYMNQMTLEIEHIVASAGGLPKTDINEMNSWLRRSLHSVAGGPEYAAPIELVRSRSRATKPTPGP